MRSLSRLFIASCAFILAGAAFAASPAQKDFDRFMEDIKKEADPVAGETYYLRHCFMYEKNKSDTTNYWKGTLVLVNTKVELMSVGGDSIVLKFVDTGIVVTINNVRNFSQRDTMEIARNLLTKKEVDIERYSSSNKDESILRAVKTGNLRIGMNKAQVLIARGFPPGHKTPSLDGDRWQFWTSRLVIQTMAFQDYVLTQARGVH